MLIFDSLNSEFKFGDYFKIKESNFHCYNLNDL